MRVHLVPFFKDKALDRIHDADVTRLLVQLRRTGRKPKTIRNILSSLHSLFELAVRRRWVVSNPCKLVDSPGVPPSGDIRFLTQDELMAVITRGVGDSRWASVDRPLYLMAAMTGLRQGELLGLRWIDLDVQALKVRVRQSFVRGEFKAPKSLRGTRGVPLADDLVEALESLAKASAFRGDDDLVFGHPDSGDPLDRSKVRKRFQAACRRAGSGSSGSTTSATRSALESLRQARSRSGRCRSGWAIATPGRRSSTPTTSLESVNRSS